MTNEEAIKECVKIQAFGVSERQVEAMEMAIKALKQEPCGNAIDRAEAIRIASGYCHPANVAKELAKLPPVTPQQSCEDITKAFQLGMALGFAKKHDEMDKVMEEVKKAVTPQSKTGHCKDCKWWKDSDGTYCRGVHAESKCPINRKEVYEGNGYCYMFEPQERSDKE